MSHSAVVETRVFTPRGDSMAWIVCLSAGLFFLYEFFQLNVFDVINQPLRDDFHINATQLSWLSSTYLWADILFLLPAGIILDRYSTRTVILSALSLCVVGTLGFALTDSFILAAFFHFLSGIGNAFCLLSCVVLISYWFPPKRQALVVGTVVTMAFIGGMLAHTPFAMLYDLFGWRKALLVDAGLGVAFLVWIYWVVQDKPFDAPEQTKKNQEPILPSFLKAFTNRQNWLSGLFTSLLNLPIMVLCALWGASYLRVVHHVPDIVASNVVSLIFMGSIIGCPFLGWLSDIQGKRKPIMIAGAVATLLTIIPLFFGIQLSQWSLSILFFALGFFTSVQVISYPLIAESNAAHNTGAATGLASVLIMGGGGVGQVLFGWLMAVHADTGVTQYTLMDFQYAMWIFPIAAIGALAAVVFTRETHCTRSI